MAAASIHTLPDEILMKIVDHIKPDPEKLVPVYYRRFLSVESIEIPPPSNADRDIRQFRKVCKRFAEAGQPALFTVIGARFSTQGLRKLEELVSWKSNVARHVKRFSYLVPYFYPEAEHILSSTNRSGISRETLSVFWGRLHDQRRILDDSEDVRVLAKALKSFTSLQVVKLLRIQDRLDHEFKRYVESQEGLEHWVDRYWAPSCTYGSRAIAQALIRSNVDLARFYMPAVNARALTELNPSSAPRLSKLYKLAARLTCLTIVFDESHDLDDRIRELAPLFRKVFTSAENMQAIHVGFPRYRPFTQPLETIFHNVTWTKLLAFGVAGWCLNADEIIDLAVRHKERLRGLRLRDVFLKEESRWKDVLRALKADMACLEWLSLRRIGYGSPTEMNGAGAEVPDDPNPDSSTEESEDDEEEYNHEPEAGPRRTNGHHHVDDDTEEHPSSDDDDDGPDANETEFPQTVLNFDMSTQPQRLNGLHESSSDADVDLEDDGRFVSRQQRKTWEAWAVK